MKLHLFLLALTIATLTNNLGHAACASTAINYAEAKKQENEKLLALKLAQSENKEATAIRQENGILTTLRFPRVLQQLINEYCYSPLEFFQYIYEQLTIPSAHEAEISAIAISEDNNNIYSGSSYNGTTRTWGTIKTWDMATQSCTKILRDHRHSPRMIALIPLWKSNGGGLSDGTVRIVAAGTSWEIDDPVMSATQHPYITATTTDSKMIRTNREAIEILDYNTKKLTATLKSGGSVHAIAISKSGKTLISGQPSAYFPIVVWDIAKQCRIAHLYGNISGLKALASMDDNTIISASYDGIKIWDIATEKCIATVTNNNLLTTTIALSTDSKIITSSSYKSITTHKYNHLLFKQLMDLGLTYEQLVCLKLIIDVLNGTQINCDLEDAIYYADCMQRAWDMLPPALQKNFANYFKEINVSDAIQKWLEKKQNKRCSNCVVQ